MPFAICLPHPHSPPICLGRVHAELGLALFWKNDSVFGRKRLSGTPFHVLLRLGGGLTSRLLVLTLPLPPESLCRSCSEDEKGIETDEDCGDRTPRKKQVRVWSLGSGANVRRRGRAGFGPLLSLAVKPRVKERGPHLLPWSGSMLLLPSKSWSPVIQERGWCIWGQQCCSPSRPLLLNCV